MSRAEQKARAYLWSVLDEVRRAGAEGIEIDALLRHLKTGHKRALAALTALAEFDFVVRRGRWRSGRWVALGPRLSEQQRLGDAVETFRKRLTEEAPSE